MSSPQSQSQLKKAIEEITESEARLRKIIDTIPTLVFCNRSDGSHEFLNQRWYDYTGLSVQEAQGAGWQKTIHSEDLPKLISKSWEGLASSKPGVIEARLRRFDGEFRWFLFRVEPLRDEDGNVINWYGTGTDIEDLRRAEEKLRQDEMELRQVVDAIAQTIMVLAPDGTALYANKKLLDVTGLTLEEMTASHVRARFFHPDDREGLLEQRKQALLRGEPFENELRILQKDGEYRWRLVQYIPLLNDAGQVVRWYVTGTDIEHRKQAEERLKNENLALREEIDHASMSEEIIGSSEALREVLEQVAKVAPTDSTVLIQGETGTGKELIARAIHKRSKRAAQAFIGVNCAAIPAALIGSELFGHEKGAFTGAVQRRLGRFEAANGGTIFLDEVGDLPSETQVALLRVLQEREFERIGSSKPISADVRVVAATNRDLEAAVVAGDFREDLFYRLNVFPIRIPPLRQRKDDIPLLVDHLTKHYAEKAGKRIKTITRRTMDLFQAYDWPGNIRELQNVVERVVILSDGETLSVDRTWLRRRAPQASRDVRIQDGVLSRDTERERALIEAALVESGGQIAGAAGAARKLGIPRQTLDSKIRSLGIDKLRFRRR